LKIINVYDPATSGVNDIVDTAAAAVPPAVIEITFDVTVAPVPAVFTSVGAEAVDPAGAETTAETNVAVSAVDAVAAIVIADVAVYATPVRPDGLVVVIAPTVIFVVAASTALADTVDRRPKPREATATSAMRLKVVFVDICFLSISRSREFPPVGFG